MGKLLGVLFDNQLSFSRYLRAMSSRALQHLHVLVKASRFIDPRGRATVYKGFVRPTLEYCSLVWMGAPCHILDRVQKRALKIIGPGLWLPSLHHRRMVAAQTVLFKLWYLPVDHPLKSLLPPSAVVRPADLRPTRQSVGRTHTHQLHSGLQNRGTAKPSAGISGLCRSRLELATRRDLIRRAPRAWPSAL